MVSRTVPLAARVVAAPLVAAALAAGCRDAVDPFTSPEREPLRGDVVQLTFAAGDERTPAFTPSGDSILYASGSFSPLPPSPGLLLAIPSAGGGARLIFEPVQTQVGLERWFTGPSVSPDGRVAYAQILPLLDPQVCPGQPEPRILCDGGRRNIAPGPTLQEVVLRLRALGEEGPFEADPRRSLAFETRVLDTSEVPFPTIDGVWQVEFAPHHTVFDEEDVRFFRPSIAPDGRRVAFSDGASLWIWDPAAGTAAPIPGTEGGILPAWSPDGAWIAFTRLVAGAPVTVRCIHFIPDQQEGIAEVTCLQDRTEIPILERRVEVVRPTGADARVVTDGQEPAWTPGSDKLVVRRAGGLYVVRADREGSVPQALPGTEGGREPVVSPDGQRVAFVLVDQEGGHDLWVLNLPQPL